MEIRREKILKEITNKPIQSTLRNIPPSVEHLFDKEQLFSLIQSLGGPLSWFNPPVSKDFKFSSKRKLGEPRPSTSVYNENKFRYPSKISRRSDKGKGQGKKTSFRSQHQDANDQPK